jgi:branched-chain amino acid transport system substrate-binding protein
MEEISAGAGQLLTEGGAFPWTGQPLRAHAQGPGPLLIGLEAPLSGDQRANGLDMWRGAKLAAEQINREGGILGRRVKLLRADDQVDPALALPVARSLQRLGADLVIGPYNSGVGVINLPWYVKQEILPVHLTSSNQTDGLGVTVQPKNDQIAPVDLAYIASRGVKRVSMLVDPSDFTRGLADQVETGLRADGVAVKRFSITPGRADYGARVDKALASEPELVYVSSYYPDGSKIGRSLVASGTSAEPFMGLGNVDAAFVAEAGLKVARRCTFSGTPEAAQLPDAQAYVQAYRQRFQREPNVWGAFTYDSLELLDSTMETMGSTACKPVLAGLRATRGYRGQTGRISIDAVTGNRLKVPVFPLRVNRDGVFVIKDAA